MNAASRSRVLCNAGKTLLLLLALPASAQACAVCMGSDNRQLAEASNSVVWSLLSLVGFIFIATGSTVFFLWRKANTPIPPHIQLIDSLTDETASEEPA